jgi:serine/threonine protein kinase
MDGASLALGIAALYTTCRDCYDFFTTVRKAEAESSIHLRELEIQRSILKAWGFHWQIHDEGSGAPGNLDHKTPDRNKLQAYLLSNRFKAEGVFNTLSALADTLSNQEKLIKRYGIQFRPAQTSPGGPQSTSNVTLLIHGTKIEDVTPVVSEVKNRLSMLNKFKWAMKDRDDFQRLITELKSHSESLYRLCPENAFESMDVYLTMECLARQESPVSLKSTSRLAIEQATENTTSSMRAGYRLLASAAILKASVNENRDGGQTNGSKLATIDEVQRVMRYLGKGLALFEGQVVYVEMRDYRGVPLELTLEQKKRIRRRQDQERILASFGHNRSRHGPTHVDFKELFDNINKDDEDDEPIEIIRPADPRLRALIVNFFKTFEGASMRDSVSGLDIAGMIDHTEGQYKGHCSILYRLPSTIGIHHRERPAENLKLRAPMTLHSLLGDKYRKGIRSMLGARSELARKLVHAVCMLHSSGWLHKNIRAESVMFFPEHVSALQEDRYELDVELDVSQPILMGYIFSRPDDIVQKAPPPTQQRDGHSDDSGSEARDDFWSDPESDSHRIDKNSYQPWEDPIAYDAPYTRHNSQRASGIKGHNVSGMIAQPQETRRMNISGFTLDYYQHPAKHADPQRLYRHAYDVYSLGILLLEVGLWRQLRIREEPDGVDGEDHYEQRRGICRHYLPELRWACGDIYANVVLKCLMVDCSDDEAAMSSERELCAKIVADLEGCRA